MKYMYTHKMHYDICKYAFYMYSRIESIEYNETSLERSLLFDITLILGVRFRMSPLIIIYVNQISFEIERTPVLKDHILLA